MADVVNKDNRMKVFKAQNQPFRLQNFYMPRCHDTKYDFQSIALINIAEHFKVLVKIRPCDSSLPVNCAFTDLSVVVPKNWENFDLDAGIYCSEIAASDVRILETVGVAETVEVLVVCNSVKTVSKLKRGRFCNDLVKDFLKQFVISPGCIVSGESSPELQCYCVVITKISGELCEAYRVSKRTKIAVKRVLSLKMFKNFETKTSELFTDLGENQLTLPKIARILKQVIVKRGKFHDKNILLVGPTACGKSSLIRSVSKEIGRIVLNVACGDVTLVSEKLTEMIETAKLHVKAQEGCVLVLKDIDRVCLRRNDQLTASARQLIQEITACLLDIRHIDEIAVVATTTSPEDVDVLLKRVRVFSQEVEITMLNEMDRECVFNRLSASYGFDCCCGALVASWTPGYVLGDFYLLFREAQNFVEDYKDNIECFKKAVSLTLPSSLKGTTGLITSHKSSFQDIGGLEDVKKILKMSVLWQMHHPEAFARFGIPPTRGILLYGPPGCAKTTLVKALACESKATFLAVSAADIYSCYVGEAEKRITKLFTQARIGAPTILFIDEIDALVGTKDGDRNHGAQERILATLLLEMDGVGLVLRASDELTKLHENQTQKSDKREVHAVNNTQVIVVGATNRPEMIDDALKRPGRFDKIIHVPAPDVPERLAILKQITAAMALDDSVDLEHIARNTELCSGADLKSICTESALFALTTRGMDVTTIQNSDFKHVIGNFRPSLRNIKTGDYN